MSILTVTQLNRFVSYYLKENNKLNNIYLKGEVTNLKKYYSSGHYYFSLKDENSIIKACMFASYSSKLKFDLTDGMSVIAFGNVGLYERDGAYQIYVTDIQPAGLGQKYLGLAQLKTKLQEKGYFDTDSKKKIPSFPKNIALVTSAEGAAVCDFLNILSRRNPLCSVTVFNTSVQGINAEKSVCEMLKKADNGNFDTIVLTRGGGSSDDLDVFNSEKICDAIYSLKKPIISAIGHEIDYTLSDYTADLRVPTPSAAAELCSIPISEISQINDKLLNNINNFILSKLTNAEEKYTNLVKKLEYVYYNKKYSDIIIKNNLYSLRLDKAISDKINKLENNNKILSEKLNLGNAQSLLEKGFYVLYKDGNRLFPQDNIVINDTLEIISSNKKIKVKVLEIEE